MNRHYDKLMSVFGGKTDDIAVDSDGDSDSEGDTVDVLCELCDPGGWVAASSAHPTVDGGAGRGRSSGIRYHGRCHWNKRWQVRL